MADEQAVEDASRTLEEALAGVEQAGSGAAESSGGDVSGGDVQQMDVNRPGSGLLPSTNEDAAARVPQVVLPQGFQVVDPKE